MLQIYVQTRSLLLDLNRPKSKTTYYNILAFLKYCNTKFFTYFIDYYILFNYNNISTINNSMFQLFSEQL